MMTRRFGLNFTALLALTVALTSAFPPSRAQAFESKKTSILLLRVESESLSSAERTKTTDAIRSALANYPNVALLPTPSEEILDLIIELECGDIDAECFQKIAEKYKADQVLYPEATGTAAAPNLAIKLYDRKKKAVVKQATGTAAGAKALALVLVQALGPIPVFKPKEPVKPPPPKKPSRVLVTLTSNVPGALVTMSGVKLGPTPVKRKLKPGRYTVKVVKKGYVPLVKKVVVKAQETQTISLNLVEKAVLDGTPVVKPKETPTKLPTTVADADPFYTQWWFWTAVGVGLAGIITTAAVLSVDDEIATGTTSFGLASPDYDPMVRGDR